MSSDTSLIKSRATNHMDAKQRIQQNLKIHRLWKDSYEDRIVPIQGTRLFQFCKLVGDLTKLEFGLSREVYQKLSETIDSIVHNAALVHWIFPYEQLKPHNVIGTQVIEYVIL